MATQLRPAQGQAGRLGLGEATSDQASISSTDLTNLTATVTVPEGGRSIKITLFTNWLTATSQGVELYIKESTTILQTGGMSLGGTPTPGTDVVSHLMSVVITPSAGSHTYKATLQTMNSGVTLKASSTRRAFLLVELI